MAILLRSGKNPSTKEALQNRTKTGSTVTSDNFLETECGALKLICHFELEIIAVAVCNPDYGA